MSSKNRKKESDPFDDYPTPAWCVNALLDEIGTWRFEGRLLEPCCGSGGIISAVNDYLTKNSDPLPIWDRVELQEKYRNDCPYDDLARYHVGDFLEWDTQNRYYSTIITNPPYTLAQKFIEKCLTLSDEVFMLLRVNFVEGYERHALLKRLKPDLYRLTPRPSFTNGGNDSCAYGWFHFGPDTTGKIHYLKPEPVRYAKWVERQAKKAQKAKVEA